MQNSYVNVNEVYPILDIINRRLKQIGSRPNYLFFESPLLNDSVPSKGDWQVVSFEVIRDTENPIDPNVIKEVVILYNNGAVDTISFTRGLNPPVDESVPEHEYINHLMIVEVTITTLYEGRSQSVTATITRENGYGLLQRVDLSFGGDIVFDDSAEGGTYENPNDFYTGNGLYDPGDEDEDEGDEE